jgi:hypothetical protein
VDWWTRLGGGIAVVQDLRSSHGQVAGDLLERRALPSASLSGVDARGQTVRRDNAAEASSE